MRITVLTVGPFAENTYLLDDERSGEAVLIDPGEEGERLVEAVRGTGATLRAIWLTHAHLDHIGGIAAVKRVWNVPIYMHPLDAPVYAAGAESAEVYGVPFDEPPPPERALADGDTLAIGDVSFDVMHAPGHTPGHVVIHGHGIAFAGDCLFAGSIGRTDLPFARPADLAASLEKIVALHPETEVFPGHGPSTTIGEERRSNPFLTGVARIPGA